MSKIEIFTLIKPNGMKVQITNYGAKIISLYAPDKDGNLADVVLGFSSMEEWQTKETYFNAVIGRYANRIKDGRFTLDGHEYQLATNNGPNHLHGGNVGFNERIWNVIEHDEHHVVLEYLSPDGEEGYPGNLKVRVTYTLLKDYNGLYIHYEATTDKPTICGFTNHAYFNLNGEGNGDIRNHVLQVNADLYAPFDDTACCTGEVLRVEGTPMDFRQPTLVGNRIDDPFFAPGRGIDNCWVLRKEQAGQCCGVAATVSAAGRTMDVYTSHPGLQVYTGNYIENNIGKSGKMYAPQTAICLETQAFPNSPNIGHFPSTMLRPGEKYDHWCVYVFR